MQKTLTSMSFAVFFTLMTLHTFSAPAGAAIFGGCKAKCSGGECKTSNKYKECGCCTDGTPYCGSSTDCADHGGGGGCTITSGTFEPVSAADIDFVGALATLARTFGASGEAVATAAEAALDATILGDVESYAAAVDQFDAGVEALTPKQAAAVEAFLETESEVGPAQE